MTEDNVTEDKTTAKRGRPARPLVERSEAELNESPAEEKVVEGKHSRVSFGGMIHWFTGEPPTKRGGLVRETR